MKKVIIIGGKGTPVVIAEQILDAKEKFGLKDELLGFAFDDESFGDSINGIPIVSKSREVYAKYEKYSDVHFIFNMYRSDLIAERAQLRDSLQIPHDRYYTFIHPLATVLRSVKMGVGNVILAGVVVNNNVQMGNFNTICTQALVDHDVVMGDSNFLAVHSRLASLCKVGSCNFFGLNSCIRHDVTVGNYTYVGLASNVLHSFPDNVTLVGTPAKVLKEIGTKGDN